MSNYVLHWGQCNRRVLFFLGKTFRWYFLRKKKLCGIFFLSKENRPYTPHRWIVRVFVYLRFQKFVLAEGYATQNFGNVTPWKIPLNSLSKYVIVSYKCGSSLFFLGLEILISLKKNSPIRITHLKRWHLHIFPSNPLRIFFFCKFVYYFLSRPLYKSLRIYDFLLVFIYFF